MDFSLFDISVPKALRDTLVIAFFFFFLHHLRYLRDHLLSFFHIYNLICPTVKIWKMSQFNVGMFIYLDEAERLRPCYCEQKILCILLSVGLR